MAGPRGPSLMMRPWHTKPSGGICRNEARFANAQLLRRAPKSADAASPGAVRHAARRGTCVRLAKRPALLALESAMDETRACPQHGSHRVAYPERATSRSRAKCAVLGTARSSNACAKERGGSSGNGRSATARNGARRQVAYRVSALLAAIRVHPQGPAKSAGAAGAGQHLHCVL